MSSAANSAPQSLGQGDPNRIGTLEFDFDIAGDQGSRDSALQSPDRLLLAIRQELLATIDAVLSGAADRSADITVSALDIDLGAFGNPPDWDRVRDSLRQKLNSALSPYLRQIPTLALTTSSNKVGVSQINAATDQRTLQQLLAGIPDPTARQLANSIDRLNLDALNAVLAKLDQWQVRQDDPARRIGEGWQALKQGETLSADLRDRIVEVLLDQDRRLNPSRENPAPAARTMAVSGNNPRQIAAMARLGAETGLPPMQDAVSRLFADQPEAVRNVPETNLDPVALRRWVDGQVPRAEAIVATLTDAEIAELVGALVPAGATALRAALSALTQTAYPASATRLAAIALLSQTPVDLAQLRAAPSALSAGPTALLAALLAASGEAPDRAAALADSLDPTIIAALKPVSSLAKPVAGHPALLGSDQSLPDVTPAQTPVDTIAFTSRRGSDAPLAGVPANRKRSQDVLTPPPGDATKTTQPTPPLPEDSSQQAEKSGSSEDHKGLTQDQSTAGSEPDAANWDNLPDNAAPFASRRDQAHQAQDAAARDDRDLPVDPQPTPPTAAQIAAQQAESATASENSKRVEQDLNPAGTEPDAANWDYLPDNAAPFASRRDQAQDAAARDDRDLPVDPQPTPPTAAQIAAQQAESATASENSKRVEQDLNTAGTEPDAANWDNLPDNAAPFASRRDQSDQAQDAAAKAEPAGAAHKETVSADHAARGLPDKLRMQRQDGGTSQTPASQTTPQHAGASAIQPTTTETPGQKNTAEPDLPGAHASVLGGDVVGQDQTPAVVGPVRGQADGSYLSPARSGTQDAEAKAQGQLDAQEPGGLQAAPASDWNEAPLSPNKNPLPVEAVHNQTDKSDRHDKTKTTRHTPEPKTPVQDDDQVSGLHAVQGFSLGDEAITPSRNSARSERQQDEAEGSARSPAKFGATLDDTTTTSHATEPYEHAQVVSQGSDPDDLAGADGSITPNDNRAIDEAEDAAKGLARPPAPVDARHDETKQIQHSSGPNEPGQHVRHGSPASDPSRLADGAATQNQNPAPVDAAKDQTDSSAVLPAPGDTPLDETARPDHTFGPDEPGQHVRHGSPASDPSRLADGAATQNQNPAPVDAEKDQTDGSAVLPAPGDTPLDETARPDHTFGPKSPGQLVDQASVPDIAAAFDFHDNDPAPARDTTATDPAQNDAATQISTGSEAADPAGKRGTSRPPSEAIIPAQSDANGTAPVAGSSAARPLVTDVKKPDAATLRAKQDNDGGGPAPQTTADTAHPGTADHADAPGLQNEKTTADQRTASSATAEQDKDTAERRMRALFENLLGAEAAKRLALLELVHAALTADPAGSSQSRAGFWVAVMAAAAHADPNEQALIAAFAKALLPEPQTRMIRLRSAVARLGYAASGVDRALRNDALARLQRVLDAERPATPKTAATNPARVTPMPKGNRLMTRQSGLVLFHPYIAMLFARLEIARDKKAIARDHLDRASGALWWLASGAEQPAQPADPLINCLLGLTPDWPVPAPAILSTDEKALIDGLIGAVISQWGRLGNTSADGLRAAFIQRDGLFQPDDAGPQLTVTAGPYDMLLDGLPWAINLIALPWMPAPLSVKWRPGND